MAPLHSALHYRSWGWCLIPVNLGDKRPAIRWTPFQSRLPTEGELRRWFDRKDAYGVAVVFGPVSGNLGARDFDDQEGYTTWSRQNPQLARSLPTVETRRGRHVYFQADPANVAHCRRSLGKAGGTGAIACGNGELRIGQGCYSVLPPSVHPTGFVYRWERPPAGPNLPIVELEHFLPTRVDATERHRDDGENRDNGGRQTKTDAINLLGHANEIDGAILSTVPTGPGVRHRQVFELARALRAVPSLADAHALDLEPLVRRWHQLARPHITTKEFEETWIDFLKGWPRVKFPKGQEPMNAIFQTAIAADLPPAAARYDGAGPKLLVSLCRELQRGSGENPFYLSCRTAAGLLQVDHTTANRWLFMLTTDRILRVEEKGNRATRRATRYRYLPSV